MYKHFAVATVCLTIVVGILADGDDKAQSATVAQQQVAFNEIANDQASMEDGTRRRITEEETEFGGGSFGSDASVGGYDAGFSSSTISQAVVSGPDYSLFDKSPIWQRVGMSEEKWNQLTDAQKQAIAKANDPLYGRSAKQQRDDLRKMSNAARSRAGGGDFGDDAPGADGPG